MDIRSISTPPASDVAVATTTARQTPTPPQATRFGEVLSNTVVRSAESVARTLPGSPVMAVAVRSATGTAALGIPATGAGPGLTAGAAGFASAAGPTPSGTGTGTGTDPTGGIAASLSSSQDMNLYYLQIQEQVNAENRSYTTLSNVLKAQHDTVKNAIGNIR